MSKIKLMFVIMVTIAIVGGLFVIIAKDTEEMSQQYQQCLENNSMRVCDNMFFR